MKNTKILILFIVIGLIVSLFVGCIPTIPTNSTDLEGERGANNYDNYIINNVPYVSQQGLKTWCLSASAAMVLSYYGRDISVEWIADNIDTGPDGASSSDMIAYIENVLGYKVENIGINKGLSLEKIIKLLKEDTPIIACQALSLTDPGRHARVIIGYDNNFKWLIAHDPNYGEEYRIPYSDFEALNRPYWPFWKKSNLCYSIVIQTGGLQVEADVDPKNGTVPLEVHCIGFASGGPIPYTYQWEFGDGNWSEKGTGIEYRNLFHTYTEPGKYNPVLHVEDSNGNKGKCMAGVVLVKEESDEEEIKEEKINALIDKFGAGFVEEDVNKVLSCCHFPFLRYRYDWDSAYLYTLSSYQYNLENMFAEIDVYIDEFINRDITFTSDSEAIVEATEHFELTDESGPLIGYDKVLLACIKEGGSWKISEYIALEGE
jgi:hypothetical protein